MTRKAGKPSPFSSPDYTPPADAPEAFKQIVTRMKTDDNCRSLQAMADVLKISHATLQRYTDICAGNTRLSSKMIDKIEKAAKKL